jgi:hypothetical protein
MGGAGTSAGLRNPSNPLIVNLATKDFQKKKDPADDELVTPIIPLENNTYSLLDRLHTFQKNFHLNSYSSNIVANVPLLGSNHLYVFFFYFTIFIV